MPRRSHPLLTALFATSLLATGGVRADTLFGQTWPQAGGWGQAWGEEDGAPQGQPRAPHGETLPAAPTGTETVFGQSWPQTGGWGQAWGDDEDAAPAPAPPRRPTIAQPPTESTTRPPTRPMAQAGTQAAAEGPVEAPGQVRTERPRVGQVKPPYRAAGERPEAGAEPMPDMARPLPKGMLGKSKNKQGGSEREDSPIQLTADQIIHDREQGIVTAQGRVEVVHEGRTLVADNISYNLKQDVMAASGRITLIEPTGEVSFADYFELTGDFKNGVANEIKVLLADHSRMAGATAQRIGGNRTDFDKAVYTACEPCRSDPNRTPVWVAKADRITHNQEAKTIEYRNAWIELGGVPVLYTPYLSHPDPTVKRQTGFLAPTAGMNSTLGASVTTPFFWAISDSEDMTVSPRFFFPQTSTTQRSTVEEIDSTIARSVMVAAQHRWVGSNGETKTTASFTGDRYSSDLRGHIDAKGQFDLDKVWRAGYQLQRTSSDNYTSLYGIRFDTDRSWLTSRPYLEGFGRRNYAMAEGFAFQGQRRTDDPGNTPLVLPHLMYSYVGEPGWKGSYWTVDSDALAYSRGQGTDAQRLSLDTAWNLPWTSRFGELYTLRASMRGDGYHASDLSSTAGSDSSSSGRAVPQLALNWRMPFASPHGALPQIIEPMAMIAASPNGQNPAEIPNEDSLAFELDENNVLRANRLVGLDRVEGGLRGGYGLRWVGYGRNSSSLMAMVAQGWRAHADSTFAANSGFTENFSDYAARLDLNPGGNVALTSRARLDKDTLTMRSNINSLSVGPSALRAAVSYAWVESLRSEEGVIYPKRNYLGFSVSSVLNENWVIRAGTSYDLTQEGGNLGWNADLSYGDECFAFVTRVRRFNTTDEDILSGYDVTFNLVLRTLASVPINLF